MNKNSVVISSSVEGVQREASHCKKKSGQSKEHQSDVQSEEADRGQGNYSKITSHFDYSNLGLFFRGRPNQIKGDNENVIGKAHSKKKSSEAISSKEGTLKRTSSKDFSNLEELYENTTIINNPSETKPRSKKKSNEINLNEENQDISQNAFFENVLFKSHYKKKSREKSFSNLLKAQKEEKLDQEIANDISKLGLDNPEEQDKNEANSCLKDPKVSKTSLKVLEMVKTKALTNRQSLNPNITSESAKSTQYDLKPSKNTFTGTDFSKLTKGILYFNNLNFALAVSPFIPSYPDPEIDDDTLEQEKFINELFENPAKSQKPEGVSFDKSKEISQENPTSILLKEKTTIKSVPKANDINLDSSRDNRKNLSLISTDSTLDSENFAHIQDHQNNSFSTPFSGANKSFNNSGKLDFSSPIRIDSGRISNEVKIL